MVAPLFLFKGVGFTIENNFCLSFSIVLCEGLCEDFKQNRILKKGGYDI